MALPHYMQAKSPPREQPENQGRPDTARIHGQHAGGKLNHYTDAQTKFRDPPPEKPQSSFVPLDPSEGVRFDDEVAEMREFAAKSGWAEVPSRYVEDTEARISYEEGMSPREQTQQKVAQRLGIHRVSFRPVSNQATKTFDDYREMARTWKAQHGIEDTGDEIPPRAVDRPSVIGEYITNGAPIVSRSGSQLTSVQRERREEAQRRRKPEPHLVASYYPDDFEHGPGSDHPSPNFKHAKASFQKERELVARLVDRLKGKSSTYSPQRLDNLAAPLTPEQRAARAAEAERSRSRHTDPGSPSSAASSSMGRLRNSIEGPKKPRFWR